MKAIINKQFITIITLLVFAVTPLVSLAADMWAETPDLNNDFETSSVITAAGALNSKSPATDLWAETPDLLSNSANHGIIVETESRVVKNFNPQMYAETPDLNMAFAPKPAEAVEKVLIVSGK